MTPRQTDLLRKLATRSQTAIDLTDAEIDTVLDLTKRGLVYDFSAFAGRRIPINLRIWGISQAGRAILEQQNIGALTSINPRQLGLTLQPKPTAKLTKSKVILLNPPDRLKKSKPNRSEP